MGLSEMRRINTAERVARIYSAWTRGDMVKWAAANPNDYDFISLAARLYERNNPKVKKRASRKH